MMALGVGGGGGEDLRTSPKEVIIPSDNSIIKKARQIRLFWMFPDVNLHGLPYGQFTRGRHDKNRFPSLASSFIVPQEMSYLP